VRVLIDGDEAHHAVRVKRLEVGDRVRLVDGVGGWCVGAIEAITKHGKAWRVGVVAARLEHEAEPSPRIVVGTGVPKGDRLHDLVDGLSQVGAWSWFALRSERAVGEVSEHGMEKLRRVAVEAVKQCGRARQIRLEGERTLADALASGGVGGVLTVLADASGEVITDGAARARVGAGSGGGGGSGGSGGGGVSEVRILIGPEGGFSDGEVARARESGCMVARFGRHTMRVETAAVVAAGVVAAGLADTALATT
jgi:16S rRNA (uracil1498-N3)-methyltransferase